MNDGNKIISLTNWKIFAIIVYCSSLVSDSSCWLYLNFGWTDSCADSGGCWSTQAQWNVWSSIIFIILISSFNHHLEVCGFYSLLPIWPTPEHPELKWYHWFQVHTLFANWQKKSNQQKLAFHSVALTTGGQCRTNSTSGCWRILVEAAL